MNEEQNVKQNKTFLKLKYSLALLVIQFEFQHNVRIAAQDRLSVCLWLSVASSVHPQDIWINAPSLFLFRVYRWLLKFYSQPHKTSPLII